MYQFIYEIAIICNYFTIHTISNTYNSVYMCLNSKFLKIKVAGEKLCGNGRTIVGNVGFFGLVQELEMCIFLITPRLRSGTRIRFAQRPSAPLGDRDRFAQRPSAPLGDRDRSIIIGPSTPLGDRGRSIIIGPSTPLGVTDGDDSHSGPRAEPRGEEC